MASNYDLLPVIDIDMPEQTCLQGLHEVGTALASAVQVGSSRLALELYPGALAEDLLGILREIWPNALWVNTADLFLSPGSLREQFVETLGDDPVFGFMQSWDVEAYFDAGRLQQARVRVGNHEGLAVVFGTGASRVVGDDSVIVCAGATRWELQRRQRAHNIANLGLDNAADSPARLYKIAFFLDWRVGDKLRHECFNKASWFVDLDSPETPRMLPGETLRLAVASAVKRPFRTVPFFDPGPWGGQWMRERFGLPAGPANYAWGFDCVPEENSVLLQFGDRRFSLPAQVLVAEQPAALLGDLIAREFGAEFPIRFDYLDTVGGGNLSLQVHPLREYIRQHFGMAYTQDESYYMLYSAPDAYLFLGLTEEATPEAFGRALQQASTGETALDAERWANRIPTRTHDHFSIPAGTVHCSGRNNVVLEISATPYIFTFKLWDWGRMGLDGKPRPIHLQHGLANIQWNRGPQWVDRELLRPVTLVAEGDGWREERTGLHDSEFLETRRHWFTAPVTHNTDGTVHVLCLVAGEAIVVESPENHFAPMIIHFGETFIVPAAVGAYIVRPLGSALTPLATMKAYVRSNYFQTA